MIYAFIKKIKWLNLMLNDIFRRNFKKIETKNSLIQKARKQRINKQLR